MKSPSAVRALSAPMAAPLVAVGRMIEHGGSFRLRKAVGSGMIRLVWKSSPPSGGEFRSGKVACTPVTGSTASGNLGNLDLDSRKMKIGCSERVGVTAVSKACQLIAARLIAARSRRVPTPFVDQFRAHV